MPHSIYYPFRIESVIKDILNKIPLTHGDPPEDSEFGFKLSYSTTLIPNRWLIQVYRFPDEGEQIQLFCDPAWANNEAGKVLAQGLIDDIRIPLFQQVNGRGCNLLEFAGNQVEMKFQ